MTLYVLWKVMRCQEYVTQTVIFHSASSSSSLYDGCFYLAIGSVVTRLLLIMAGDIEENPGPPETEELIGSLATLITEAPAGVKPVLAVWAPDKGDMVADWNSNKFIVPVLKEAMAWLQNSTADEVSKQLKKKLDLATALPVAIERLLPDECGSCQAMYTVGRADNPTLQCAGCHQGIHEVCLSELLGEGIATLTTLHGSLTWLCPGCAPNYRMMTVMTGTGGLQRPASRRQLGTGRQSAVSPTPAPVDEIADRLAAMSVSAGQSSQSNLADTQVTSEPVNSQPQTSPVTDPNHADVQTDSDSQTASDSVTGPPTQGVDCPFYIKGDCQYGISGKKGGICSAVHRKRCSKFMRWGNKSQKGCKNESCPDLHPQLCPASMDLLCTNPQCGYKLHVQRCKRKAMTDRTVPGVPGGRPPNTAHKSGHVKGKSDKNKNKAGQSATGSKKPKKAQLSESDGQTRQGSGCCVTGRSPVDQGQGGQCNASDHGSNGGQAAEGALPEAPKVLPTQCSQGFQSPTVQHSLEAWLENVKREMMLRQDTMLQLLRVEMMQPRPPMLGRGGYGLHPSF